MPPDGFAAEMQRILTVYRDLPALKARLEANPDDLETASTLISVYAGSGDTNRCRKIVRTIEEKDPENTQRRLGPAYSALADAYIESGKFRNAMKYYERVVELATEPAEKADALIGRAYAQYMDGTRFEAGSRPAMNRIRKAKEQLDGLLGRTDLPEDRMEQVRQLLAQVAADLPSE
jgi:tetratricopeptide (TPR) repeat protein